MDSPIKAVIGRNGLAPLNEKQEGDGRTPSGIFRLERAFGYPVKVRTKLVYAPVDEDDFWVDDPAAATYNRWVKGLPKAGSFERLRREDFLYRYAIVVEYNTNPIVAGKGSAIFVHVWRTPESSTAGCVAMSAGNVRRLLRWLDPEQNPVIILGDQEGAT
ncbi:MAG: hypothetical protein A2Y04_06280 [Omnitrophica WOR_2 bacterium GWC2_45_7]|nr:MAG: hypothetical protein A2Z81_01820 [Omnitrophica WOR_2 bacterium GWA2_45_18]OGX19482.1 MAG: hypothetical protein A2Y04_06280 [Omnitrophica WOR_2 bacterium GWC2_45_7]